MPAAPAIAAQGFDAVEAQAGSERPLDERAMSKLRWRCRRGLLENDLLLERLFTRAQPITQGEANGLYVLMQLADNDLLDLFLGRQKPTANLDRPEVRQVLEAIRTARKRTDNAEAHSFTATTSRISP
jgi:antitoxin CptB